MSPEQFWPLATLFAFVAGIIVGVVYTLWVSFDDEEE